MRVPTVTAVPATVVRATRRSRGAGPAPGDALRQILLFAVAYGGYQLVRSLVDVEGYKPFGDATRIINLERVLHVFIEPTVQRWVSGRTWLMDLADWTYLNAHYAVTFGVLVWLYLRRNESFYFVRNLFLVAMGIALVGYYLYPTAPPRLMPEWGFSDSIEQFTGVSVESGPVSGLVNFYAAVPSVHVCFSLLVGLPAARLVERRSARILWRLYPVVIVFVVVATGNHFLTDAVLGGLTALLSAVLCTRWLARARPHAWSFNPSRPVRRIGSRPRLGSTAQASAARASA